MKKTIKLLFAGAFTLLAGAASAQMSGTYSVPGSFTSIATAIQSLNAVGVSGPVTIQINAGYTETVPVGGFTLTATGTSANPIVFQKNGLGANPLITAYGGGTATPASAVQDGIWRFVGCDYITVDGIDLYDPNTANPSTMEFGYGFFKASATNGCQNNVIKNCVITLNRINGAAGTAPAVDGSRGIDVVNATTAAHTTALTITSAAGSNSNNQFYSNTIQNCNIGIALIGFAAASPFTLADTGNDIGGSSASTGNLIINYGGNTITAVQPAAGVRTLAQYNLNVSYNTINNNNGSGLPNASTLRGIYLNTALSANATISSNTISLNSGTTTSQVSAIENVAGGTGTANVISITNNLIANGTSSTTTGAFYGIYNTATTASLIITGNTFSNNTTNATSGATYLLRNTGGVTSYINASNNTLTHNNTNASGSSGTVYGIYFTGTGTLASVYINNNTFGSFNYANGGTGSLYYINNGGDWSNLTINSNNWNNLTVNNSGGHYFMYNTGSSYASLSVLTNTINNYARTAASGLHYCYYGSATTPGTAVHTFSGNIFSNITSTVSGTGAFYGIHDIEGNTAPYPKKLIFSNVISNINVNTTGAIDGIYTTDVGDGGTTSGSAIFNNTINNISGSGILYGVYTASPTSASYPVAVYSNTIGNLASATSTVFGSYVGSSGAGVNFFKNKIYDLTTNGTAATAICHGIYAVTSTTSNIYNNVVGNLSAPAAGGLNRVNGIFAASGTNLNFFYNTVYFSGTSTGTDFGTNAIYTATTVTNVNLRNNIFTNLSTPTGTGVAAAYRRSGTSLANYNAASNDNLYYAGTPGANNVIFTDGTNAYQSLPNFVAAVAPLEGSSITENPTFQSTVGSNANFLNINTTVPTQIESSGNAISGITDDIVGTTRNATTPDIGAWEGAFTLAADNNAPTFLTDGFTSTACNLAFRTYTINLSDNSGVATGSLSPRVYYKVNSGPYTSVSGTLTSGSVLNGVWTFSMTYTANPNDVISYYVVAQDAALTPNLGSLPTTGFVGVDVNNVTTNPTTPYTYTVTATLNGTYTIGSLGSFTTLTQAANAYNTACLTGPVTYVLTDASYSTNETFPVVFTNNLDASSTNSLLIIPATANNATITPVSPISSTLKFLNARYITMDGLNTGGSSISVVNTQTSTTAGAVVWLASTSSTGPGNNNLAFRNLSITGPSTASGKYGILSAQDAANPVTTGGIDNDFITVYNNTITTVYYGIYSAGNASVATGGSNNWLIDNNKIGTASSAVGYRGMFITNAPGIAITNNNVGNIFPGASGASGIYLSSAINGASVSQNTITNITCTVAASGATGAANGIYLGTSIFNTSVDKNVIYNITNTNSGGYAGRGITVNAGAVSGNTVSNNMISSISGTGDNTATTWPIGIALEGTSAGVVIVNNSVNMSSSIVGLNTATASAALYVNTTGTNNVIVNNLLNNTYDNTAITTDVAYGVYSSAANANNIATMNYNNYYVGGTGNIPVMGYVASTQQLNLAAMQSSFGGNLNSQNVAPVFTTATDLHLIPASNGLLDNLGTPFAGVTVDIDNQTRNVTTPDIGADEFFPPACTTANGGTLTSTSFNVCNGAAVSLASNGVSTGTTSTYQWMVSSTPGGPYTNVSSGSGATTASYNTGSLTTSTLYYVLQVTCPAATLTSVSNEATVVINPIPTASVSSNGTVCAGQNINLTGSSDIGTNYSWTGPNSFGSSVQNPTVTAATTSATGVYTLVVSTPNCSATAVTTSITVNSTSLSIVSPVISCIGSSTVLTAIGSAVSFTWNTGANTNTISIAPATSTVYSVSGTGSNSCVATATTAITVINPTITGIGAISCGIPSTSTLSVNAFTPSVVKWYPSLTSTVSLATGTNYVPAAASTNTTFYAEASGAGNDSLFTNLAGTLQFAGLMFDVVALNQIIVSGFDAHFNAVGTSTVEIWYRPGSFVGFETSNAGWTLASTTTVAAGGVGVLSTIPAALNINIPAGQTYGFYLAVTAGTPLFRYSTGTSLGAVLSSNSDVQILQGKSGSGYFNITTSPRSFNGEIKYSKPGCTSPRIPVTLTVAPQPTVSASASTASVCAGSSATLTASGANTYSWTSGGTATVEVVNPTSSSVYTVTGTDLNGCTSDGTVALAVNALPNVSLSVSAGTVCVNGSTVNLVGSPSGGVYTGSNVSTGGVFTPGATAGTFNPTYTYTDAVTGCSNSATASIIVDLCTGLGNGPVALTGLSVYPNPNAGEFTIELNNGQQKTIELTDLTGRIVLVSKASESKIGINITGLANGVYFAKIQSDGAVEIVKIIKQ